MTYIFLSLFINFFWKNKKETTHGWIYKLDTNGDK